MANHGGSWRQLVEDLQFIICLGPIIRVRRKKLCTISFKAAPPFCKKNHMFTNLPQNRDAWPHSSQG